MKPSRKILVAGVSAAFLAAPHADAVFLNPDGLGQALIYPYYTVRSANGNPFNTYISVVNTSASAVAVRVRAREGRAGREVVNFNLYLGANDLWTGAVVPTDEGGAKLISVDLSCTTPLGGDRLFPAVKEFVFSDAKYSGSQADGLGTGLDRTREGYIEMIEMASLSGQFAAAVTHVDGVPDDCGMVQALTPELLGPPGQWGNNVWNPEGMLAGTLTLINVANGQDFTVNAEALQALTTEPFLRKHDDPYPDFDAAEVNPVSEVTTNGKRYRLTWDRGIDAVSSVLMQASTANEFVLDYTAGANTEWVFTMPTRRFYVSGDRAPAPFTQAGGCESAARDIYDRQGKSRRAGCHLYEFSTCPMPEQPARICHASSVWTVSNGAPHIASILGSNNPSPGYGVHESTENGWARLVYEGPGAAAGIVSNPTSTELDGSTDPSGRFRVLGLPVLGFMLRTFSNGTLACGAGVPCQANYGSAFPHRPSRRVVGPT